MMKVQLLRMVMVNGQPMPVGSLVEVQEHIAHRLIASDQAVKAPAVCPPKPPSRKKAPKVEDQGS